MNEHELRHYARLGALESARRAVIQFPDILAELNQLEHFDPAVIGTRANGVRRPRRAKPIITGRATLATTPPATTSQPKRRHYMSRKGRASIARAMKARWAALKAIGYKGRLETAPKR